MENVPIKKVFYLSRKDWLYNLTDGTRLYPIKNYSRLKENGITRSKGKYVFEQGKMYLLKFTEESKKDIFVIFRVTYRKRIDIAYWEYHEGNFIFCFPTDNGPPVLMSPYELQQYFNEYCYTLPQNSKVNVINFAKYLCSSGYLSKYLEIAKPAYYFF